MAYFKPYIDETGFHYPTYNDTLEMLVSAMQTIYGSGIYLGQDSQDYQLISIIADLAHDCFQTAEIAYNAQSPVTAMGTGLDYNVALNGISRKPASASTVELTLSGVAGTRIESGLVSDVNDHIWELPELVTITGGSVKAEATCTEAGAIQAEANSITHIMTPTLGWEAVTNEAPARTGTDIETDSELRARQASSTAQQSQSIVGGLYGALISLTGVTRCVIHENDTSEPDSNGIPGHSICVVIEGGEDEAVAETILLHKGMGCGTYGDTSVTLEREDEQADEIHFDRPSYVDVDVEVNITRRAGYTASIPTEITNAIVNYLSTFTIGTDLATSILWMIAQQVNDDYRSPVFSITSLTAAKHSAEKGVADIPIAFNEVVRGDAANITVNLS